MSKYIQSFNINSVIYGIEKTKDGFYVWKGGCDIKTLSSIQEARVYIYQRALGSLMNDIDDTKRKLETLKQLYNQLNPEVGDEFVLGRFLI